MKIKPIAEMKIKPFADTVAFWRVAQSQEKM
jgi:hypothetical protein